MILNTKTSLSNWWIEVVLCFVVILFCLLVTKAQTKNVKTPIKNGKASVEETLSVVYGMIDSGTIPITGVDQQLNLFTKQLNAYETTLKFVKTKEEFEATIPRIAAICNSVNNFNKMLEIFSPNVRREINLHFSKFRKSLDEIVLIYLKHENKRVDFIRFESSINFAPFYLALSNYHNDWKKNYEF